MNLKLVIPKIKALAQRYFQTFGFILLLVLIVPTSSWLFGSGYFNMHDDLQVMRIFEMVRCFNDNQIPCRWSPDMSNGYGQAMFNFYSTLPYYLGFFYKLIFGASYLGTVKFLFAFSLLAGALGMFLLAKEFWGYWGGLVSAVLYTYAPYHAVDVYVRGALAEAFALAILPYVWLYSYRIVTRKGKYDLLAFSLSLFALFTTHNISSFIYAPFTMVWVLFWIIYSKNYRSILQLTLSGILGFGMSAFFLMPAIIEQNLVDTSLMTTIYYSYTAHFVTLYQLFISRFWGDGGSTFGANDSMSFAIGWPHWWLLFLIVPVSIFWFFDKNKRLYSYLILLLTVLFFFSAFLTHSRSIFIWQHVNLMGFIQFPWRFLGLSIFFISLAGGTVGKIFFFIKYPVVLAIIILTIFYNISYFTPVHFSREVTDEGKLSGLAFELQQRGGYSDYLPKGVTTAPEFVAPDGPRYVKGEGEVRNYVPRSNGFSLYVNNTSDSQIVFPYIYFPNWKASVDGSNIPVETNGAHNVIKLSVSAGEHIINTSFYDTPVRTIANLVTIASLIFFIISFIQTSRKPSSQT